MIYVQRAVGGNPVMKKKKKQKVDFVVFMLWLPFAALGH